MGSGVVLCGDLRLASVWFRQGTDLRVGIVWWVQHGIGIQWSGFGPARIVNGCPG